MVRACTSYATARTLRVHGQFTSARPLSVPYRRGAMGYGLKQSWACPSIPQTSTTSLREVPPCACLPPPDDAPPSLQSPSSPPQHSVPVSSPHRRLARPRVMPCRTASTFRRSRTASFRRSRRAPSAFGTSASHGARFSPRRRSSGGPAWTRPSRTRTRSMRRPSTSSDQPRRGQRRTRARAHTRTRAPRPCRVR